MNVEADFASRCWERPFLEIQEQHWFRRIDVDLSDSRADRYAFDNATLMRGMLERLVETLQEATSRRSCNGDLVFGNKFFMTMNEQQQRRFFHCIFNLRVYRITVGEDETDEWAESPAITISTPALLETIPQLIGTVRYLSLTVRNFALTRQSDVQALSNVILSKRATLAELQLKSIECPVDDSNKQDSDEPNGFLDPLFYATSSLRRFCVSTKTRSVHSTLVSPTALRALIVEGYRSSDFKLNNLGLTDTHVLAIVDSLSTRGTHLSILNLESNPGITAQGYGALFNLINRINVIGDVPTDDEWRGFCLDDKAWEGKLNLVSEMNSRYHRLEYLTNGTFTSEDDRWEWLERVASLPGSDEDDERMTENKKMMRDAKHLNFIWYTLCENPEMMQT